MKTSHFILKWIVRQWWHSFGRIWNKSSREIKRIRLLFYSARKRWSWHLVQSNIKQDFSGGQCN